MADATIDGLSSQLAGLTKELNSLQDAMNGVTGSGGRGFTGITNRGTFGKGKDMLAGAMGTFFGAAAGTMTALSYFQPDVGLTMAREATLYETSLRMGGRINRSQMAGATANIMPYMSFAGADAAVTATLASSGILPGGRLFEMAARTSSNLTGLLNVDTQQAAMSQAQFYSGATAGSLYRAGVMSRDPRTGQQLSQGQIFDQLYNRLIRRDMTTQELSEELRSGFLGAEIAAMPLDALSKEMFTTYLFSRAGGGTGLDFGNQAQVQSMMDQAEAQGFNNLFRREYELQATETGLMEQGYSKFAEGANAAYDSLIALRGASAELVKQFGSVTAGFQTFFGSRFGAGVLAAGSTVGALAGTSAVLGLSGAFGDILGASGLGQFAGTIGQDLGMSDLPSMLNTLLGINTGAADVGYSSLNVLTGGATLTSFFGERRGDYNHQGVDFAAAEGTAIKSARDGNVENVGYDDVYGYFVDVRHADGTLAKYGHMKDQSPLSRGAKVSKGQHIGNVGSTGLSSGPHLHVGFYDDYGLAMDPMKGLVTGTPTDTTNASGTGGGGYQTAAAASVARASSGSAANGVVINVSVLQASEAEALRLAEIVKRELENDSLISRMASR